MHQPVRAVKDQVAAVEVCGIPKDGQSVLLRAGPGALCPHRHRTDAPFRPLQGVCHRRFRVLRFKGTFLLADREGQVIELRLRVHLCDGTAVRIPGVGNCPYLIHIIHDLDLLLTVDIPPFAVPVGDLKGKGVLAVDLAGHNDVIGVFQHRLPCPITVQHHRTGIADLLIGRFRDVIEPDIDELRCPGGVCGSQRYPEPDIRPVGGRQFPVRRDCRPIAPFLQVIAGGSLHQGNRRGTGDVLAGHRHTPGAGEIAVCRRCGQYTFRRVTAA